MNLFKRLFGNNKLTYYTDNELIVMGDSIKNKVIALKMKSPYNKVIISEIVGCKYINGIRFIELIGYNLNRQKLSLILNDHTYIKICNKPTMYEATSSDDIYLKNIQNLDT